MCVVIRQMAGPYYKLNDSFDKVECCFDKVESCFDCCGVTVFGNNVERNFDSSASHFCHGFK